MLESIVLSFSRSFLGVKIFEIDRYQNRKTNERDEVLKEIIRLNAAKKLHHHHHFTNDTQSKETRNRKI